MKLGQGNIFTSICLSTGGRGVCLSACWDAHHPPGADTHTPPQEQTHPPLGADTHPPGADPPSRHPPGADTPREQTPPRSRHPPDQPPQNQTPPQTRHPPRKADCSIRLTSGRYASYWNAFLFTRYIHCLDLIKFF